MRAILPATVLSLTLAGCETVPTPEPMTRAEMAEWVKCEDLPAGIDCTCVVDKALAAYPTVPLTVLNETPGNAAQSQAVTRTLRKALARKEATEACAPGSGAA